MGTAGDGVGTDPSLAELSRSSVPSTDLGGIDKCQNSIRSFIQWSPQSSGWADGWLSVGSGFDPPKGPKRKVFWKLFGFCSGCSKMFSDVLRYLRCSPMFSDVLRCSVRECSGWVAQKMHICGWAPSSPGVAVTIHLAFGPILHHLHGLCLTVPFGGQLRCQVFGLLAETDRPAGLSRNLRQSFQRDLGSGYPVFWNR